jgi:hypothetical protein
VVANRVAKPIFVRSPFYSDNLEVFDFVAPEGWPSGLRHRS